MEPLNHSLNRLFLVLICSLPLRADVLSFFNPSTSYTPNRVYFSSQLFIANDTISLKEFFSDWEADYRPKSGKNIALESLRVDVGGVFYKDFYIGYLYRYDVFIKTQKDFTDLYYLAKNKKPFLKGNHYNLDLHIEGVKESGIMIAKRVMLYHDNSRQLSLGVGVSLLLGHDMQEGDIWGGADTPSQKVYEITAQSSYHYTTNYLYYLDVNQATGLGFGSDISLTYHDSEYDFDAAILINDLFSKIYWDGLPYSYVNIETKNKSYDADGYVKYAPSISGVEQYRDYTQRLETKIALSFEKGVYETMRVGAGVSFAYGEYFPYLRLRQKLSKEQYVALSYENRFGSFGVDYHDKYFYLGVSLDALSTALAAGLRAGFSYSF
jgi:hypothetical protein